MMRFIKTKWSLLGVFISVILLYQIFTSKYIPFVYMNRLSVSLVIGYLVLVIWFTSYIIFYNNLDKNFFEKKAKKRVFIFLALLIFPIITGDFLSALAPVTSNLLPNRLSISKFKVAEIHPYSSRYLGSLVKVSIIDRNNSETEFYLRKGLVAKLQIAKGDRILVTGRQSYIGLRIQQINEVRVW